MNNFNIRRHFSLQLAWTILLNEWLERVKNLLVQHYDIIVFGVLSSESQGQVIGLWPVKQPKCPNVTTISPNSDSQHYCRQDLPGVDKVEHSKLFRQRGSQPLSVVNDVVIQEAGVGTQELHLRQSRLGHGWVAVSNCIAQFNKALKICLYLNY